MKIVDRKMSAGEREIFELEEFLSRPLYAHLAHNSENGPRESPVWFHWDGEAIWIIGGASFPANLKHDPRCALGIVDWQPATGLCQHVGLRGRATVLPFARARATTIFQKYFGPDENDWEHRFDDVFTGVLGPEMVRFTAETVVIRDQSYGAARPVRNKTVWPVEARFPVAVEVPLKSSRDVLNIRTFRESDTPSVVALLTSVFGATAPHNDPTIIIADKLAVQPDLFLVALAQDRMVGTLMGGYDGHRGWVYSFAVAADVRRRGIGTALIRRLEQVLAAKGCRKVNLQVRAHNAAAVAFYENSGFDVEDRVSMGKVLSSSPSG